jgi:excisionase family DNA binding protein
MTASSINGNDFGDYISQVEAARIRGVSKQAIADLIKRGRLPSFTIGGKVFVKRSEVVAFQAMPIGRPPKKSIRAKLSKETSKRK